MKPPATCDTGACRWICCVAQRGKVTKCECWFNRNNLNIHILSRIVAGEGTGLGASKEVRDWPGKRTVFKSTVFKYEKRTNNSAFLQLEKKNEWIWNKWIEANRLTFSPCAIHLIHHLISFQPLSHVNALKMKSILNHISSLRIHIRYLREIP